MIGCIPVVGEEEWSGVGNLALRHFRLLSAAAAVFTERRGEPAEGTEGTKGGVGGGRAEGRGSPITETLVWTLLPPPTLSGRIGEGSPPPPAGRRGAEPVSGEATLSARVVMARARHLETVEHSRRAKASGSVRTRIGAPGLSRLSFRGGIVTLRIGGVSRVGGGFFCAGVPSVPTPGCLPAGWGEGSFPCGSPNRDVANRDGVGKASRPTAWRSGWRICCPAGGSRVALLTPSSVLSDEVSFH